MLQNIREHTQGWIAGVIIGLLILSFALWGIHSYLVGGGANNFVVAKVNGEEITKGQVNTAYERLRRQFQMQNNQFTSQAEVELKEKALQNLIHEHVLKQASLKQDYRISMRQVDALLASMPEFQADGQFSPVLFRQALAASLLSPNDFLDLIQTTLLIDQPRLGLIFSSFALPNEITESMALIGQEREIKYFLLSINQNSHLIIPDEKVLAYYKDHQDEFKTPEQVSVEFIAFSVNDLIPTMQVSPEELKNYYNDNINTFTRQAEWKLESVLLPIAANSTPSQIENAEKEANELAEKAQHKSDFLSLSKQSSFKKTNENLTAWTNIENIPASLQKTVVNLTKAGQVSTPIKTNEGFVIVKVIDYKPSQVQSFDQVKNNIKNTLLHQKAVEKFSELKEQISNITYEHPDSLTPAAKLLNANVKVSALFTKEKGSNDISNEAKIREVAFSNDVLNLQNNSDVIQLNSDSALVIRIKSHVPAAVLPFESVKSQISEKLKRAELEANTAQLAEEIKKRLQQGSSLEAVASQYHLTLNNVGFVGRRSNKIDPVILEKAFEIPKPSANHISLDNAKTKEGYAIIIVNSVRYPNNTNNKQQYQVFAEQLQNMDGLLEYELYKQSLINQAKIVVE